MHIKGVMMMRHVVRSMETLIAVMQVIFGDFGKLVISLEHATQ